MSGSVAVAASLALAFGIAANVARANDVADFYRGRSVSIVVANEPGTGFDIYGRTLARHIGRFIPGNPNIVVQNMVGASGIAATNWLYNVAPRDGTVMATFVHTVPFEPLMGNSAAKYDPSRFTWIGNMESIVGICGVSKSSGIQSFDQLREREAPFGATGITGALAKHALALKHLFGARIKLVPGYHGTASIKLAMKRGEVAGLCALGMSTVTSSWKDDYDSGAFKPILQLSGGPHPDLRGIPHVKDFAKTEEDAQVIGLIFGTQALGRPFASTPEVPPERTKTLRAAFMATMKDRQFLADAAKTHIDISAMSGEEVAADITRLVAAPPAVVERATAAVRND